MKKVFLALLLVMILSVNAQAAYEWRNAAGENSILGSENPSDIDSASYQNIVAPLDRVLATHRQGCDLSYSSTSEISVSAGEIVCSNSAASVRKFRQNTSATTVDWDNIDTGTEATDTKYYVYSVADADANTFTIMISTSSTSPTGATCYRQLGSFYNDSDGDIVEASVYANNYVKMNSDGKLPAANSPINILHATESVTAASYADMDDGGQWTSFDITLNSTSTILVIGGVEISTNHTTDASIQVVYDSTQIAVASAGGDASYPNYEKADINGIAINVAAGTYTIKAQLKAGVSSVNTLGKIYCTVYIIPE